MFIARLSPHLSLRQLPVLCVTFSLGSALMGCASSLANRTPAAAPPPTPSVAPSVAPFITNMRQLTFDGARAGEGYFSRDGQSLIFQSEREAGNPFYQIYLMDLQTGATKRLSNGEGKTTCAWIHPDQQHALFASTHADPGLAQKVSEEWNTRKSGKKAKYAWSFDDQFDIYQVDLDGRHLKNLTHSPGYDAEASYSPDGKWIAFASNRQAYLKPMTDEQKKLFQRDPSYMMDIYIMRADGSDVKQLTHTPGYDGGPFFSPDGQRLTFRRFSVDGGSAEVHTMNVDGSDDRQLTHLKAMSWAPFYHPSGDYLIFTTNKMGFSNFELYIVDVEGRHEPVRVSDIEGFDGLPVFTPDGNGLIWTHANDKGEGQLFRAEWNDSLARKALGLAESVPRVRAMADHLNPRDAQRWVEYLASPHMQGRMTGGPAETEYMGTVAKAFGDMGLQPSDGERFEQKYTFTSGIELKEKTSLRLKTETASEQPILGQDWTPLSFSKTGGFSSSPLTFAGYGIVAPASSGQPAYDAYGDLDVKNKWVVVFDGLPDEISNERRFHLHLYSRLQHKAMMARQHGAAGLIVIDDANAQPSSLKLKFEGRGEDAGIPVLRFSSRLADSLFKSEKSTRQEWTNKLAKGEVATLNFSHVSAQAEVDMAFKTSSALNTIGLLKVPGAKTTIVIGAHGDHLGHGEMGNSLWRGEPGAIHLGADDNASGVAGVLEIARDMTRRFQRGEIKLKQNVEFAIWSGEEIGILGSSHFIQAQPKGKISAYLNLDMIGRMRDHLMVQGTASAPEWTKWIERVNAQAPLAIRTQEDPYLPTDAMAFYMHDVPVLSFFTGSHAQYHMPTDSADLIFYPGLVQTAQWVENMAVTLASQNEPVHHRKVESSQKPGEGRGFRLYLGTIPDYSQEGKDGVVISGTSKDSPAEKAGLQPGDKIIELGGMKIQNLYDYVYCLQALKANVSTPLKVMRSGTAKNLEIRPVLKNQ